MFHEIRDHIINIVTSRLTVLTIMFFFFAGVLVYRCFNLQIINGEEYLNDLFCRLRRREILPAPEAGSWIVTVMYWRKMNWLIP